MKLPILSGKEMVKILLKEGFAILDQKGSHIIMFREKDGIKRKPVVPQHEDIKKKGHS
ncbi:type II toxin-antitoxin system HicA family toxin [Candidatus Woesearchaeota archaeon]|nr:type II toxin-antitoxin system HicA family toxin [Candidatus Woesearchaeota archaeon]